MRKRKVFIISFLILFVLTLMFTGFVYKNRRIITLEDTGFPDSGSYKITSRSDIKKIDTIINSMKPLDIDSYNEIYRSHGKVNDIGHDEDVENSNEIYVTDGIFFEASNEVCKIGGFLAFIKEKKEGKLMSYTIRAEAVIKSIYEGDKEEEENLISETYYQLDDEHFQLLRNLIADKKEKKK